MAKGSEKPGQTNGRDSTPQVDALANRVLSMLATRKTRASTEIQATLVDHLCAAVRAFDPEARAAVLGEMRALGLSDIEIAEVYIPAAARKLGDDWCVDQLSFADVTIGSARLQGMLRDLETGTVMPVPLPGAPQVLMVVRQDEYHTLGALVAARYLRRHGVIVRLALGLEDRRIARMAHDAQFDVIMISASGSERLESLRNLIKIIRQGNGHTPPIIVGGTVLEKRSDIKTLTDADHVCNDPEEALKLCGLRIPNPADSVSGA